MIKARLRKTFPAKPDSAAFSLDLEFQAAAGVTVLFGPSGSGKTLTLDLIAGFVRPDDGRILLDDEILFDGAAGVSLAPQARNCGYVFQNYALFPHNLDECFELGEEMLILREGRLVQSGAPSTILDQPANVDVARLLGVLNLIPGEIRALDPGRNTSKVQMGEYELDGPYFPGHLKGDRVTVCVRPERLAALARNGRPGANQIPAQLERAVEKPQWMH